jgi:ATP-dependent Clp protease protease subunit
MEKDTKSGLYVPRSGILVPTIIQKTPTGREAYDLFSSLLQNNSIIMISGVIENAMADIIVGELLYLNSVDKNEDINIYIDSPGGSVTAGLAIISTMRHIIKKGKAISTICMGQAASMGSVILASGSKGKRFSLPYARIMIHQVSGGAEGPVADMKASIGEAERLQDILYDILAKASNKTVEEITKDADRDHYFSPEEAKKYGLIDGVVPIEEF